MTLIRRGVIALALAWAAVSVDAKEGLAQAAPLVVEVRTGAAVPVGTFSRDGGVDGGPSFGLDFALSGAGRRSLYVGFSQHRFGCESAGCVHGGRYVATGFDLGLRFSLVTSGPVMPWIRVGAVTTRAEATDLVTDPGVSDLGIGGEAGIGVYVGAQSPVAINPGVRVAAVNTRLPGGELLRMRFVVADLAIALAF